MPEKPDTLNARDKQIICGLFLSKFDQAAVRALGFESFVEAFNTLGYSLGAKPASIKNYRDELDPYFPNERKGWHKRPLRAHCKNIMDTYSGLPMEELEIMIRGFLLPDEELQRQPKVKQILEKYSGTPDSSFAKRLITGRAAEEYFLANRSSMPEFANQRLTETTQWGCGFDFKLELPPDPDYSAVEVKGLRGRHGPVQFTSLEYEMADALASRYFLVLVRNFSESPFHTVVPNPLRSKLQFKRIESKEVRISWLTKITQ